MDQSAVKHLARETLEYALREKDVAFFYDSICKSYFFLAGYAEDIELCIKYCNGPEKAKMSEEELIAFIKANPDKEGAYLRAASGWSSKDFYKLVWSRGLKYAKKPNRDEGKKKIIMELLETQQSFTIEELSERAHCSENYVYGVCWKNCVPIKNRMAGYNL